MEYEAYYLIAFFGGLIAGAINTLAGNGSMITLAILTEVIGLPGTLANGTNRIGVLLNCIGGLRGFSRSTLLKFRPNISFVVPVFIGALIGVWLAITLSNEQFLFVYKTMMVLLFFVILAKPARWIKTEIEDPRLPYWFIAMLLFLLGIYGGFIQMGMGLFFLALMVLGAGLPLMQANVLKLLIVLLYTLIVVWLFQSKGLIDWEIGLVLGIGQYGGSWITARFGSQLQKIEQWTYYLLLIMVVLAIAKIFGWIGF